MLEYLENSIVLFFAGKGLKGKAGFLSYLFLNIVNRLHLIGLKGKEFRLVFKDVTIWADASSAELGAYMEIYAKNIYEKAEGFEPKPDETVLDIGSNIGLYAIKSSKKVGEETGRIWAFEPNPSVFSRLLKNLDENKIANVIAMQKAVSSKDGKMKFAVVSGLTPEGKILHEEELRVNAQKAIEVDCIALDNFVSEKGFERINLAKIDVEGEEYEVLKGAEEKMLPITQRIVLEYHNEEVKEKSAQFLKGRNFDLVLDDRRNRVLYFKNKRF